MLMNVKQSVTTARMVLTVSTLTVLITASVLASDLCWSEMSVSVSTKLRNYEVCQPFAFKEKVVLRLVGLYRSADWLVHVHAPLVELCLLCSYRDTKLCDVASKWNPHAMSDSVGKYVFEFNREKETKENAVLSIVRRNNKNNKLTMWGFVENDRIKQK